nr:EpsD family peptidyl-prolyl cis-trans isomerase [uncultured Pseudomonas sp.]
MRSNSLNNLLRPASQVVSAVMALVLLAACTDESAGGGASQVAAKVDGAEITLHQVNYVLSKAGSVPPEAIDMARKQVLDRLIEQELFAAKAVEEKLDRSPQTLLAIEQSRREILAAAYMDQVLASGKKLNKRDVSTYYYQNPELFAERKVYNLEEISFPIGVVSVDELKALVAQGSSLEQLQAYLEQKNVDFKRNAGVSPAEKLPLAHIKELHNAEEGQIIVLNNAGETSILQIVSTSRLPVSEAEVAPVIQQFLFNQLAADLHAKQLKPLKEQAKIEYMGVFADLAKSSPTLPVPPATPVTGQ